MSDSDTANQLQSRSAPSPAPLAPLSDPVALLVLDTATGRVAASNPAARRRLAGITGADLARRLSDLATAAGHGDGATVRTWTGASRLRAVSAPVRFHGRDALLVLLRDDTAAPVTLLTGEPRADVGCAVLTLDALGRIDGWGATPQSLFGYGAEHVIGADTTLLLTPPARLAGEHHLTLTNAYRTGEHRAEGWRLCADGRLLWAEVTTAPLYDATDRLLGFAQVVHDLTPARRLQQRRPDGTTTTAAASTGLPAPRVAPGPSSTGSATGASAGAPAGTSTREPAGAPSPPAGSLFVPGALPLPGTEAGTRRPRLHVPAQRRP